ncbi:hypothetical protein [Bradyrhizobium sp.]|uniref:hypothetical protein n=1 Tax=Bradyrhizobium sp. TaxID=376 RepID=UPI003C514A18
MPDSNNPSFHPASLRRLRDFATGAGAATLVVGLLLLLLAETARRGVSSAVFRYVGF